MAPGALAQVLGDLPNVHNDNLLVGFDTSDDASVFRVGENLGLVQSIDFFPPMVDDPFLFGQIAAANSLSDIYAMGGRPSHAMNLLCIPSCLGVEVAGKILAGGADKCVEAGCSIAGGHTINDDEPKYGLSVSGFVSLDRMLANSGARAGDVLLLTKRSALASSPRPLRASSSSRTRPQPCLTRCAPSTRRRFVWPRDLSFTAAPMSRALA